MKTQRTASGGQIDIFHLLSVQRFTECATNLLIKLPIYQ